MNGTQYQRACLRTWADHGERHNCANAALGLSGEVGEVVELVKKDLYHSRPVDVSALQSEMGDVVFYLAVLAHEYGIDLGEVMAQNVAKLRARHPAGWNPGYHHQHGE